MNQHATISCEICRRLGKKQCGYLQFKNSHLSSSINSTHQYTNKLEHTRVSFNHNNINPPQTAIYAQHTPQKKQHESVSYQQHPTQSPQLRVINYNYSPQSHLYASSAPVVRHQTTNTLNQQSVAVYYPIYPVYEVVYEEVRPNFIPQSIASKRTGYDF